MLPELEKLVRTDVISIVDAVLVTRTDEDTVEIAELEDAADPALADLTAMIARVDGLVSDEDAQVLAAGLPVGGVAVVLFFEHTWVVPLRDAIAANGGELLDTVRVPGPVVDEVLAALADQD